MGNWSENRCITYVMKYIIELESNGKKTPMLWKNMSTNFPGSHHAMGFVAFSCTMGNWWGNPCFFHMMKYTIGGESYGENPPVLWESMSTNFPGSPHGWPGTMGNLWKNPCISHMMTYTIGWDLMGKKAPILWEKYEYQFLRLSSYNGFCCILLYFEKLMGKSMHFLYNEIG